MRSFRNVHVLHPEKNQGQIRQRHRSCSCSSFKSRYLRVPMHCNAQLTFIRIATKWKNTSPVKLKRHRSRRCRHLCWRIVLLQLWTQWIGMRTFNGCWDQRLYCHGSRCLVIKQWCSSTRRCTSKSVTVKWVRFRLKIIVVQSVASINGAENCSHDSAASACNHYTLHVLCRVGALRLSPRLKNYVGIGLDMQKWSAPVA